MCEWNYKVDANGNIREKDIEDNILYLARNLFRHAMWKLRPWRHGTNCKWGRRLAWMNRGG